VPNEQLTPQEVIDDLEVSSVITHDEADARRKALDNFPNAAILSQAALLVTGDRNKTYGHPQEDFARTAALWSAIFGFKVTPMHVALCMICVKMSRQCHVPKTDNLVDIAGYAQTAAWLDKEKP